MLNIKDFPTNNFRKKRKWKKQRIEQGFCDADTFYLSDYWIELMIESLKRFKEVNDGHPISMTEEDWDAILNEILMHLNIAKNGIPNQYEAEYDEYLHSLSLIRQDVHEISRSNDLDNSIQDKYLKEQERIVREQKYHLSHAFDLITKYYFDLWW